MAATAPSRDTTETTDGTTLTHARVIAAANSCGWCGGSLHGDAVDGSVVVACSDCGRDFV
ncbi:hypothetical protein [Halobaculum sp. MBLA0143]|uniref:hypothetical protein n=1 Tax=Halobaculum sp. MBLA0143 TaxID=3079933 RepID=UPI0035232BEF